MAYVTAAAMRAWVGITDPRPQTTLEAAIDAAGQLIDDYCGQQFDQTGAVARVFAPCDGCVLHLPPPNRISTTVDLIVKSDVGGDGAFETTWASSDYQLEPVAEYVSGIQRPWRTLRAVGSQYWPVLYGRATVQITAKWGWPDVPPAVKHATMIVATDLFKAKDTPFGVAGFGEFGSIRVGAPISPQAKILLSPFVENPRLA